MIRIKMKKCLLILLSVSLSLFAVGGCGRSDDAELIKVAELCLNAYNSLTYGDNGEIVYLEDVLNWVKQPAAIMQESFYMI